MILLLLIYLSVCSVSWSTPAPGPTPLLPVTRTCHKAIITETRTMLLLMMMMMMTKLVVKGWPVARAADRRSVHCYSQIQLLGGARVLDACSYTAPPVHTQCIAAVVDAR